MESRLMSLGFNCQNICVLTSEIDSYNNSYTLTVIADVGFDTKVKASYNFETDDKYKILGLEQIVLDGVYKSCCLAVSSVTSNTIYNKIVELVTATINPEPILIKEETEQVLES